MDILIKDKNFKNVYNLRDDTHAFKVIKVKSKDGEVLLNEDGSYITQGTPSYNSNPLSLLRTITNIELRDKDATTLLELNENIKELNYTLARLESKLEF